MANASRKPSRNDEPTMRDVMSPAPRTIGSAASLAHARALMTTGRCKNLAVLERGAPVGVVSEADISALAARTATATAAERRRVADAMSRNVYATNVDASVQDVARVMRAGGYRHTVVLDGLRVVGISAAQDVFRHLIAPVW